MLHKTKGIVFKTTDYAESSVIAQIFTEKFGLQSYIFNGVKKPKAKINLNMLQPLHLLDMVVYYKTGTSVQRVSEVKSSPVLISIPYDMVKTAIVLFLNEVLYKTIRHQNTDQNLFGFIFHSIEWLDTRQGNVANFHLLFLMKLTQYIGFYPEINPEADDAFFDMKEGLFTGHKPQHKLYISAPYTRQFNRLLKFNFEKMELLNLNNEERRYLITKLLDYYAIHIEGFGNIRSHDVLEQVLS